MFGPLQLAPNNVTVTARYGSASVASSRPLTPIAVERECPYFLWINFYRKQSTMIKIHFSKYGETWCTLCSDSDSVAPIGDEMAESPDLVGPKGSSYTV
jgi:hypothetical protein